MALELKTTVTQEAGLPRRLNTARFTTRPNRKPTARDRMFFTEQLALLLETGANLHAALQTLRQESDNPAMQAMLDALMTDIAEGKPFSHALAQHPKVFSSTYINLIAASEGGGFMGEVLAQLLEMDEKRQKLQSTMISAFSYPAFLLVFSIAVVVFVLLVVFPKFGAMFAAIHDQLPPTTKILMEISDALRGYWLWFVVGSIVSIALVKRWLASPAGTRTMDGLKLSVPGIREIYIKLYLLQALRVMSLSLGNGVTVVDTLNACKDVIRNSLFRHFIVDVENCVQEGRGIAAGFKRTAFIPSLVSQMVTTGEDTGNLPKVMGRLADFYERDLEKKLLAFSKMIEPVMLVVMGLIVGLLVSSLVLPIFKLSRAVS